MTGPSPTHRDRDRDHPAAAAIARPTARSLPIALLRAREAVMAPVREMLAEAGLTEQQWRVLRVLDEDGPSDATRIAARACLLAPSLSRILAGMERRGLVRRAADATDRRRAVVSLTDAGRAVLAANAERANALAEALAARLGAARMELLLDLLNRLAEGEAAPVPEASPRIRGVE
ncbi:MAG: homoprotocatechuate degradation operon regulator HpaR [Alphaproteobacteria bacterium]|nr:MAG: homoprotocatechuate degradation operon regulator HpaR [Alphaproteobacteria bacterium]